jgi:hypothetical protein
MVVQLAADCMLCAGCVMLQVIMFGKKFGGGE